MARSTASGGESPLQRWRQQKDKVLEADSVLSEYLPAGTAVPAKTLPSFSDVAPSSGGGTGDLGYVPIQAPRSKGEATMISGPARRRGADPTMVAIQAPAPKGEATMKTDDGDRRSGQATVTPGQGREHPSAAPTMTPGQGRERPSAQPTMTPGRATPAKDAPTMVPGQTRERPSAQPTMTTVHAPRKDEAAMMPGQTRERPSAQPSMTPGRTTPAKDAPTMVPGQTRERPSAQPTMTTVHAPRKDEAAMMTGQTRERPSAKPTMVSAEAPPPDAGPTMIAGENRAPSAGPTMMEGEGRAPSAGPTMTEGEGRAPSAGPTMMEGEGRAPSAGPTMIAGETRRQSAPPTMVPIQAPRAKGEATMIPGETRRPSAPPTMVPIHMRPRGGPTMVPSAYAPRHPAAAPQPEPDDRPVSAATVNTFIDELRLIASGHGMDFSIIQPDAMKIDFFTDTKALRVIFTGREIAIDRVVVSEVPAASSDQAVPSGSARRRMLEWERQGIDAGRRNATLRIATVTDPRFGALRWHDGDAPGAAKAPPKSQVAIEARYFDTDDGRNWLIELVNGAGDETPGDTAAGELTSDSARRLVMLLLNIVQSITAPKPAV